MVRRKYVKKPKNIILLSIKAILYLYILINGYLRYPLIVRYFSPVLILIAVLIAKDFLYSAKEFARKTKHLTSDIKTVDKLDGIEFEHYLCARLTKKGYKVKLTPPSNDYGVDLVISKGREKIAVQAKRYNVDKGYLINYNAVQQVAAGKAYYGCNKGMVITNSFFTKQAKELAKANDIELWDRQRMIEEFQIIGKPKKGDFIGQSNIESKYAYV